MDKLDWLARNVDKWEEGKSLVVETSDWPDVYFFNPSEVTGTMYNREEWLKRRRELGLEEINQTNEYGLDVGYFSKLIKRELSDISRYTPGEFARVCARMAATADSSVLSEPEFTETTEQKTEKEKQYWVDMARARAALAGAEDDVTFASAIFEWMKEEGKI